MHSFFRYSSKIALFLASFQVALPAHAIPIQINWTGDFGYSATGSFTFSDVNTDGFARTGEFTSFSISFFDDSATLLISYNLSELQSFTSPSFNFNYDITNNEVLQSGNNDSLDGFALGNSQDTSLDDPPIPGGYLLRTDPSNLGIEFTSGDFSDFDTGGTVSATAVPWETDIFPLMGATLLFGGAMWWKRKRAEKSLKEFDANQESDNQ